MLKMQTIGGKYVIFDRGRILKFDKSYDAWVYVFLCKEVREKAPFVPRSLYPVRSLNPVPERKGKTVLSIIIKEIYANERHQNKAAHA